MGTYTGQDKRLQYLFENGGGGGGTTVIANPAGDASDILKKLQVGSDIYSVLNEGGLAVTYHANWTATASTGVNTKLTQELNLPAGKYIAVTHLAYSTNMNFAQFAMIINDVATFNTIAYVPISYGNASLYFELTEASRVAFGTATGLSMSWDSQYINRGGMDIIAIPDTVYLPEIYSTEERQVGVWTDGKPLYQKTVHISALPSTAFVSTTYSHNIANVDKICGWDGTAVTADGTATAKFNVPQFNSSGFVKESSFVANVTKTDIAIIVGANRSTWTSDFTIQYTKTTDTAGSGIWTPQGSYAHHYSTTERLIGTWLDNKPLYERAFLQTTFSATANTWYKTETPRGNMKYLIDVFVVFENAAVPSVHKGMSGGFVDGYLAINSFRNVAISAGVSCYVVAQYTKTTD